MNILWLSHIVPYPPKGGVLQRSYNLMKELAKYNNLFLLTFDQDAYIRPIGELNEVLEELSKICKIVDVIPVPCYKWKYGKQYLYLKSLFTYYPYTLNWLYSNKMKKSICDIMNKINIDIVHFDTISLAIYYNMLGNCKKIMNHHNIESHMMIRRGKSENNIIKKLYYYQEGKRIENHESRLCKIFDLNITCSKLDSHRLKKIAPLALVDEVPNGIDLEYFHPLSLEKEAKSLIFAGGMSWYPNRKAMIYFSEKIWPLLKKEIPGIKMTVVGRNPPELLVNISREDNNFKVTGFVDDVRPHIDKSMVYVCPIDDGGGTKLKILDALAMGKPIVADPIACEGIDVVDGETVMFAKYPEDYVAKIKLILDNNQLFKKMSGNAVRLAEEKYSFAKIGVEMANMYESLNTK